MPQHTRPTLPLAEPAQALSSARDKRRRLIRRGLLLGLLIAALVNATIAVWRHFYPAIAAQGWSYQTYLNDIERVSALNSDNHGGLFVSQEIRNKQGRILQIDAKGQRKTLVDGLSKPDGMAPYLGGFAFSQEQGVQPVQLVNSQGTEPLFNANSVEGLASDGYYLYAIEDLHQSGHLLRYDPSSRRITTLRSGLDEAEAITSCPDGRLFYTEKRQGHVRQLLPDGSDPVVLGGLREPGFLLCNGEGLWITEDATHMARVLLWENMSRLSTVLSHLRAPQTIIQTATGQYLIAEQGRNRILTLQRSPDHS